MGRGEEKKGFMDSRWMTITLVVVLIVLAVLFVMALKKGWFYRVGRKGRPALKPAAMNQQLYSPNDRLGLKSIDNRLGVVAELSWQKSVSPPLV